MNSRKKKIVCRRYNVVDNSAVEEEWKRGITFLVFDIVCSNYWWSRTVFGN